MRFLDREQARLDREPCWHHPAGPGGGRAAACCMPVGRWARLSGIQGNGSKLYSSQGTAENFWCEPFLSSSRTIMIIRISCRGATLVVLSYRNTG